MFDYGPQELINITLPVEGINIGNKVYLAYKPGDKNTNLDYVLNRLYSVLTLLKIRPIISCYEEENCPDIPVINCNSDHSVFKIVKLNETKIYKEENCLVLQGDNIELNKIANKISLVLLGIEK